MFLNDQETAVDLLYEAIAQTVVKLVRANIATPLTIGIHGDGGAAKINSVQSDSVRHFIGSPVARSRSHSAELSHIDALVRISEPNL